jgi:hypothetical protein
MLSATGCETTSTRECGSKVSGNYLIGATGPESRPGLFISCGRRIYWCHQQLPRSDFTRNRVPTTTASDRPATVPSAQVMTLVWASALLCAHEKMRSRLIISSCAIRFRPLSYLPLPDLLVKVVRLGAYIPGFGYFGR